MNQSPNARRAAVADEVVDIEASNSPQRGSRSLAASRRLVAATVAGALSATALFAFAFNSRSTDMDASSESLNAEIAVPAAAASAAELGFADRSQEVSRSAVRSNLTEAVADENAKERTAALGASAETAAAEEWKSSTAVRDQLMDEDMKLVAAQSEKLRKEAEEAARLLAEAKKAAEEAAAAKAAAAKASASGSGSSKSADVAVSAQDVENLTTKGGSMPVKENYRMGAGFGARGSWSRYHTGQDFPAPTGTPIYAAASGVVLSSSAGGWAGVNVVIQHNNGGSTLYAHMSRKNVSPGATVKAGQLIGYVGNTGRSFGSHLHFEYYEPGVTPGDVYNASNPMSFLRSLGVR
ncbi:M23 family metallopeptidase [Tessaracoccus flavus]|uniref:M23 family metallopeptidase n=1 Tax=Tessaracoccus flavus TaxID=1610493 RepID=UPI00089AD3C5|nr:M23 family metallopeptidase [Tessaracoccus flavus]SDY57780.1 Peptidase family M23 [Tessaracoccus flavus]